MKGPRMQEQSRLPADTTTRAAPAAAVQPKSVVTVHASAAAPQVQPRARFALPVLLASLATSGLLLLCYFPVAWSWPAWFALVPLLGLVRTEMRPRWVYLCAYLSGAAFFVPVLSWMGVAHVMMIYAGLTLGLYCAVYFPVGIALLRLLDRKTHLPLTLTLPVVWVTLEFFRSFLLTGFAWYYLGHSQHSILPLIQVADLGGVYAVTFVVALVNGLLFEWLYTAGPVRQLLRLREPAPQWQYRLARPRWLQTALAAAVVLATLSYGGWRLGQTDFTPGPVLSLLQSNIDQRLRNEAFEEGETARQAQKEIIHSCGELCWAAVGKRLDPKAPQQEAIAPDLIVWPESSFPLLWLDYVRRANSADPNAPAIENQLPRKWEEDQTYLTRVVEEMASPRQVNSHLLLGINTLIWTGPKQLERYTSALLVRKPGQIGERYDKIKRVPFGEYVPLRETFPFMKNFTPYDFDYSISRGEHLTRFTLDKYRFGVLICYEDTDPFLARQYGTAQEDGPAVDFLVNISNDGWFDGSSEHNEHLAVARFRAVEARRAVARAVNMGISAVIDSNGRVLAPSGQLSYSHDNINFWNVNPKQTADLPVSEWSNFKQTQGVWTATIPIDQRTSLYSLWGDWFALTCCGLLAVGMVCSLVPPKKGEK